MILSDMAKANESGPYQYTTLAKDVYWSVLLIYMAAGNSNVGTGPLYGVPVKLFLVNRKALSKKVSLIRMKIGLRNCSNLDFLYVRVCKNSNFSKLEAYFSI